MKRNRQNGFTLIEVIVALGVIALAMVALIAGAGEHADRATYLQQRTLAHWVAMNKVAEFQLSPDWPRTGTTKGRAELAGRQWRWEAEVSRTDDPDVRRLDVKVFAEDGNKSALATMLAYLPRPL